MDPISAFGLATSTVQVADFGARSLFALIKILKNLKEAPERLVILFNDLEHFGQFVHHLHPQLKDPNSALYRHFNAKSGLLDSLTSILSSADSAMCELHKTLQPLVQFRDQESFRTKAWHSIVSLKNEKTILQKAERLEKLKLDLTMQLDLCDIESQLIQSELLASLQQPLAQIQSDLRIIPSRFNQIEGHIQSTTSNVEQTHVGLQSIQSHLDTVLTSSSDETRALQEAVVRESQLTRTEIQSLRDELMRELTSPSFAHRLNSSALVQLDDGGKKHMGRLVGEQLLQHPQDLEDASQNIITISQRRRKRGHTQLKSSLLDCYCFPCHQAFSSSKGIFNISFGLSSDHQPSCVYYKSSKVSRSYNLAVQLLPFLRRTIELAFTTTTGAGGSSIAPNIRVYRTVKRLESPVFQLFDQFHQSCAEIIYARETGYGLTLEVLFEQALQQDKNGNWFVWNWNVNQVSAYMDIFKQRLETLFRVDYVLASDRDEDGNSIFHEIIYLAISLGVLYDKFAPQFENLMFLASQYGADKSATASIDYRPIRPDLFFGRLNPKYHNVAETLIGHMRSRKSEPRPHLIRQYRSLQRFGLDDTSAPHNREDNFAYGDLFSYVRAFHKRLVQEEPDLAEDFLPSALHAAVARRASCEVKRLLDRGYSPNGLPEMKQLLCPLEVALGWCAGMELLLDAGANSIKALHLAFELGDVASLEILLSRDCPLFDEEIERTSNIEADDIVYRLQSTVDEKVINLFVDALKDRRNRLKDLASENLSRKKLSQHGISDDRVLDSKALRTYNLLMKKGIAVPKAYYPGTSKTVYSYKHLYRQNVSIYESLFSAGFLDVDEPTTALHTPLLRRLEAIRHPEINCAIVLWFLDKGANPNFSAEKSYPNILFYLAASYWEGLEGSQGDTNDLKTLIGRACTLCDPLVTDNCSCYCSSNGCLPSHQLTKYDCWNYHDVVICKYIDRLYLHRNLQQWVEDGRLNDAQSEIYYREACRQEIFSRLGMAHTCCINQEKLHSWRIRRVVISDDDREQLQREDAELFEQLQLIMQMYQECRRKFTAGADEFWNWWWKKIDAILPDMIPEQRCKYLCMGSLEFGRKGQQFMERQKWVNERSSFIQAEALRRSGYADLDFIDVIRQHFAKVMDSEFITVENLAADNEVESSYEISSIEDEEFEDIFETESD